MGRAFPIRKRTCHIVVTLAEGPEPVSRANKKKAPAASAGTPPPTAAAPAGKKE